MLSSWRLGLARIAKHQAFSGLCYWRVCQRLHFFKFGDVACSSFSIHGPGIVLVSRMCQPGFLVACYDVPDMMSRSIMSWFTWVSIWSLELLQASHGFPWSFGIVEDLQAVGLAVGLRFRVCLSCLLACLLLQQQMTSNESFFQVSSCTEVLGIARVQ